MSQTLRMTAGMLAGSARVTLAAPMRLTITALDVTGRHLDRIGLAEGGTVTATATYDPQSPSSGPIVFDHGGILDETQSHDDADIIWSIGTQAFLCGNSALDVTNTIKNKSGLLLEDRYTLSSFGLLNGVNGIIDSEAVIAITDPGTQQWHSLTPTADELNGAASKLLSIDFLFEEEGRLLSGRATSSNLSIRISKAMPVAPGVRVSASGDAG